MDTKQNINGKQTNMKRIEATDVNLNRSRERTEANDLNESVENKI
jgi:hypothetical protein